MGILLLDQFAHEQPLRLTVGDNEVLGSLEVVLVGDLVIRRAGQRVVAKDVGDHRTRAVVAQCS
jgi:hypothetical protein